MKLADNLPIDLSRLVETRALITASSGAGKSWVLRLLLEQTHGKIQQLVIDPEGEFASLREKFDFILAGKGGDCPAEPRSAALLARRLLELGKSAVLDIYELEPKKRAEFVRTFLSSLVDAPRDLWHPVLVIVDEAHTYAPEKGQSEALDAVASLMSRGRKRGFCGVLATQRLAKLHKDVAAEAMNVLVGRMMLDVDAKRGAEMMGFANVREGIAQIRALAPGEFFAVGPAIAPEMRRARIGKVVTSHPKAGQRGLPPPPAPAALRKALEELAALPAEAEAEIRDLAMARARVGALERELGAVRRSAPAPELSALATARAKGAQDATEHVMRARSEEVRRLKKALEAAMKFVIEVNARELVGGEMTELDKVALQKAVEAAVGVGTRMLDAKLEARGRDFERMKRQAEKLLGEIRVLISDDVTVQVKVTKQEPFAAVAVRPETRRAPQRELLADGDLPRPRQRILDELLRLEGWNIVPADKIQLALWCEVSPTSGGYFNNLGALRGAGLIDYPSGGSVALTAEGREIARLPEPMTQSEMLAAIYSRVGTGRAAILRELIAKYPESLGKDELADLVGVSRTSGGYFNNLGSLRTLGLIDYPERGRVAARAVLFI